MADAIPERPSLDPGQISSASFARARKGFEPTEVRSLLGRAADALRVWTLRDEHLSEEVKLLAARVESAEDLDEERATELLGSQTAQIVSAARAAADEIRQSALDESATLVAEAHAARREAVEDAATKRAALDAELTLLRTDAESAAAAMRSDAAAEVATLTGDARARHDELVAEARAVLSDRTAEAEVAVAEIRQHADEHLAKSQATAESVLADAQTERESILETAREEGRSMVNEAQEVRRRILHDLATRRRSVRQQLEAARVAREVVVESIRTSAIRLDDTLGELEDAERDSLVAADMAAAAVPDEVYADVDEMEADLVVADLVAVADSTVEEVIDMTAVGDVSTLIDDDPGATVHDLFEKLRSSSDEDDSPDEESPDTAAVVSATLDPATLDPATLDSATVDLRPLDRRDVLLAPSEQMLARHLKRLVSDEQNDVLDRARRHRKGRVELTMLLDDDEGASRRYTSSLEGPYVLAATAGAQMWGEATGTAPHEIESRDVLPTLKSQVDALLEHRGLQIRAVLEGMEDSGSEPADLVDRLRAAYRELRATSLPELAGDLATSGFNAGAAAVAGEGSPWNWVADNGGMPCSDAEDNALEGTIACGAVFPTGDVMPPAHPGCRCIVVPPESARP